MCNLAGELINIVSTDKIRFVSVRVIQFINSSIGWDLVGNRITRVVRRVFIQYG